MTNREQKVRRLAGWSLEKAAVAADVSRTTIIDVERRGLDAVKSPTKRAAIARVYSDLEALAPARVYELDASPPASSRGEPVA